MRAVLTEIMGAVTATSVQVSLSESRLRIGSQMASTAGTQVAASSLTPFLVYYIYAVNVGGQIQLVISDNVNSVGPAGYSAWKLLKGMIASSSGGVGSLMNVKGTPRSSRINYDPPMHGSPTVPSISEERVSFWRNGKSMHIQGSIRFDSVNASDTGWGLPPPYNIDVTDTDSIGSRISPFGIGKRLEEGVGLRVFGNDTFSNIYSFGYYDFVGTQFLQFSSLSQGDAAANMGAPGYQSMLAVEDRVLLEYSDVPILEWSDTPLEEL